MNSGFPQHLFISHSNLTTVRLANDSGRVVIWEPRFFQSYGFVIHHKPFLGSQHLAKK